MKYICTYTLLEDSDAYDRYGVCVSCGGETTAIPHLTHDRAMAIQLLELLKAGQVTPCTAGDVAEDFLAKVYGG